MDVGALEVLLDGPDVEPPVDDCVAVCVDELVALVESIVVE